MKLLTIFEPKTVPCKGMVTTMDSVSLTTGQYELLQNVRVDTMVFKVRDGAASLSASGLPNGWCAGAAQLTLNGTDYVFVAVDTGSKIQVYYSSGVSFTEMTQTGAGLFNQTRFVSGMTPSAYSRISFVAVKAPTRADSGVLSTTANSDLLLCSDGVKILIADPADFLLYQHSRFATPTSFGKYRQEATFPDFMPISSGLSGTDRSDADVTVSTSATVTTFAGGVAPQITFSTGADTDDYGELQWTTANDICQGPCAVLMYTCSDPDLWYKVKLEFRDASGTPALKTIWDPTSTSTAKRPTVVVVDATKKVYMAVFPLDESVTPAADTYDRLRLTYKLPASPGTAIDFFLLGWYAGGVMPGAVRDVDGTITGTTQFKTGMYSSFMFSEGEAVKNQDLGGVEIAQLGMTDRLNSFRIPVFAECTYAYRVTYEVPDDNTGVEYALFYVRFPDPSGFRPDTYYLVSQDQFATKGSATYTVGDVRAVTVNTCALLPREAKKPFHRPAMPFKCAVWADGRLFLGGVKTDNNTGTTFGGFFASAKGDPFDFSEFERFLDDGTVDLTGPVVVPLGGEIPQGMASIAGTRSDLNVTSPLVVVTDRGAWAVNTSDALTVLRPVYLCNYGTKAPDSVVSGGGAVWWFDKSKQIRKVSQDIHSPSLWRVESLWFGIPTTTTRTGANPQTRPRSERVCCAYFKNKLYVAYTPTGQSYNVACSVYDDERDLWYDDALGVNFERLLVWPVSGDVPQLRAFSVGDDTDGAGGLSSAPLYYQHEQSGQTTDAGTGITINILTPYLHMGDAEEPFALWSFQDVGIVADKSTGQTLSVVKTSYPNGDTVTGSIDMETQVTGNQLARWERDSDGNKPQLPAAIACRVSVQGTYASGKRVMAVYMKVDSRSPGTGVKQ